MSYTVHINGAKIVCSTADEAAELASRCTDPCASTGVKKTLRLPAGSKFSRSVPVRRYGRTVGQMILEILEDAPTALTNTDLQKLIKRNDPEFKNLSKETVAKTLYYLKSKGLAEPVSRGLWVA